ncbi:DUF5694 domain-containing protein [Oceanobacillus sp. CAU 1775]
MNTTRTEKPKILILGTFHMGETTDLIKSEVDNLLSDHRQKEIISFTEQIAKFKPTKLAVEMEKKHDEELNKQYRDYLLGSIQLPLNEVYQLGFRIAKMQNHKEIYCVDWMEEGVSTKSIGEVYNWARDNQPALFNEIFKRLEDDVASSKKGKQSILEMFREQNESTFIRKIHQSHLNIARIQGVTEYIGIDWLIWWYQRNLILFSNLSNLASSNNERILFIVGSGHVEILTNFFTESEVFQVESVDKYLYE